MKKCGQGCNTAYLLPRLKISRNLIFLQIRLCSDSTSITIQGSTKRRALGCINSRSTVRGSQEAGLTLPTDLRPIFWSGPVHIRLLDTVCTLCMHVSCPRLASFWPGRVFGASIKNNLSGQRLDIFFSPNSLQNCISLTVNPLSLYHTVLQRNLRFLICSTKC